MWTKKFVLPWHEQLQTYEQFSSVNVKCHQHMLNKWWLACYSLVLFVFACQLWPCTVYPKKYAHGFVVLCFVVVMQSFIMNSHEVFIHIYQGCFAGTGAIVRLAQCQWSNPDGYGKISQCLTTTKHSKAKTVCIFLGIYCTLFPYQPPSRPYLKLGGRLQS